MLDHIRTVFRRPALLRKHQPLFLLSHMRANTSLLGHILGSNSEISGYYEMHIGYYSWKSLWRQKLIYYKDHPFKSGTKYLFDKVLHDFHNVDIDLLNENQAKVLFSVREPEQTIKSIVSQFTRERPGHEFCDVNNAVEYYIQRLTSLKLMASECREYFYFDADDLREKSESTLQSISCWLKLGEPLSDSFDNFHFSGKLDSGDLSGNLEQRKILKKKADYSDIIISPEKLKDATSKYIEVTRWLKEHSVNRQQWGDNK